jgi:hypothetical protein
LHLPRWGPVRRSVHARGRPEVKEIPWRSNAFTKVPKKTFKFAEFMHHIGALKTKAESWKELYFAEAPRLGG